MRTIFNIQPKTEVFTKFEINNIIMTGVAARGFYTLLNEETGYHIAGFVDITPEEYDNWGTDDNYIYDLILSKVGVVKE